MYEKVVELSSNVRDENASGLEGLSDIRNVGKIRLERILNLSFLVRGVRRSKALIKVIWYDLVKLN